MCLGTASFLWISKQKSCAASIISSLPSASEMRLIQTCFEAEIKRVRFTPNCKIVVSLKMKEHRTWKT
jgi:hypothetical protein